MRSRCTNCDTIHTKLYEKYPTQISARTCYPRVEYPNLRHKNIIKTRGENSEHLYETESNVIQNIVGTFLHYVIAIDNTILTSLSDIAAEKSKVNKNTVKKITKVLHYLDTNPDAAIQYHANGMILYIHSNMPCLSVSEAKSRASGIFFLAGNIPAGQDIHTFTPIINDSVHVVCKILCNIMVSAAEIKRGTVLTSGQDVVPIQAKLI